MRLAVEFIPGTEPSAASAVAASRWAERNISVVATKARIASYCRSLASARSAAERPRQRVWILTATSRMRRTVRPTCSSTAAPSGSFRTGG